MDHSLLDQLAVPQPPYRMARPASPEFQRGEPLASRAAPVAVLAAVEDTPPKPPVIVPEENLSIVEAIEQQEAAVDKKAISETENLSLVEAIEAARNEEGAKLDAALPPEGATPEEVEQDIANKEEAKFQVDVTVAEIGAEARAAAAATPRSEGEIRQQKFAEKSKTERKKQVTRDQTAALKEEATRTPVAAPEPEAVVEPQPEVGSQQVRMAPTPEIEKARQATEPAGDSRKAFDAYRDAAEEFGASDPRTIKARDEYRQSRAATPAAEESMPEATESAPDFEKVQSFDELYDAINQLAGQEGDNWLDLIPLVRDIRERATHIPADQLSKELGVFAGNPLQAPLERLLAAERPHGESAEEPVASEESPVAVPEEAFYRSGGSEAQKGTKEIEELGADEGLSFWEKWELTQEAGAKDWKAQLSIAMAKWASNSVEYRNSKIKEWEEKGKEVAKKGGLLGVARSFLWHETWASWHKMWGRRAYKGWQGWDDARVVAENARDEILDRGAARIERAVDSFELKAGLYADERDKQEVILQAISEEYRLYSKALAAASGAKKQRIQERMNTLDRNRAEAAVSKSENEVQWKKYRQRAAKQRKRQQQLSSYAIWPARIDTTPVASTTYDWLPASQRRTRPGGSPASGARAKKVARRLKAVA